MPSSQKVLSADDWRKLYLLSHRDPTRIFEVYSSYYLSTSGQIYWSDTHQLSTYIDDYHQQVDRQTGAVFPETEMITEVYVARSDLGRLMSALAADFRRHDVQVIYGTIRLMEKDTESFLAWAKRAYVCVVMNLHVETGIATTGGCSSERALDPGAPADSGDYQRSGLRCRI